MREQSYLSRSGNISREVEVRNKILPFFPLGFPNELFASIISFYHIVRGHPTVQETLKELFDSGKFSLTHAVPQHMDRLAERIPGDSQIVVKGFYRNHTLLPLFEFFGGKILVDEASSSSLHRRIVGNADAIYICPECLREDQKDFGSPYIHRSHQIPTSTCCWRHGSPLIDRCPECKCPVKPPVGLILAPWTGCECGLQYQDSPVSLTKVSAIEKKLAKFGHELLHCPSDLLGLPYLLDAYRGRARDLGFAWGRRVNRKKLVAEIESTFGKPLLAKIDCSYRKQCTMKWLHFFDALSVKEASISQHMILGAFLYEDSAELLDDLRKLADQARQQECTNTLRAKKEEVVDVSPKRRFDPEVLLERVIHAAKDRNLSLEQLWIEEYASMKRLVRKIPNVMATIEGKLKQYGDSKIGKRTKKVKSMPSPEVDAALAESVRNAGAELHADIGKPQRITKNQLLLRASGTKTRVWPTSDSLPRTQVLCELLAESQWHFYGRRLLWTMLKFVGRKASKSMLVEESGLENRKAGDVLDHLLACGCQPANQSFSLQLEKLGIPKNWAGPYPDRQYPTAGRKYVRRDLRP